MVLGARDGGELTTEANANVYDNECISHNSKTYCQQRNKELYVFNKIMNESVELLLKQNY